MSRPNHRIFANPQLCLIIASAMALILFSSLLVRPVQAETIRSAQIVKVIGIVHIQKAAGAKAFRAYEGMILEHGDTSEPKRIRV